MATIHVKFQDRSNDFELSTLFPQGRLEALGVAENSAGDVQSLTDSQIKTAVADHLDVDLSEFDSYTVQRHTNGNATVRPDATFGK